MLYVVYHEIITKINDKQWWWKLIFFCEMCGASMSDEKKKKKIILLKLGLELGQTAQTKYT